MPARFASHGDEDEDEDEDEEIEDALKQKANYNRYFLRQ